MNNKIQDKSMFILYVNDQGTSMNFYRQIIGAEPILHVPGMTEFKLTESVSLGLMPEEGIKKILGESTPHPKDGSGIPRCELYLFVDNPKEAHGRLVKAGGKGISNCELKPWGDYVAYGMDLDGHIIAFAKRGE